MQVVINGNVITVKSSINFADLKELGPVFAESEAGKKVYGVSVGTVGNLSDVGACFTYGNAEGKACLNAYYENMDVEEISKKLVAEKQTALANLQKYEDAMTAALESKKSDRAAVEAIITIG